MTASPKPFMINAQATHSALYPSPDTTDVERSAKPADRSLSCRFPKESTTPDGPASDGDAPECSDGSCVDEDGLGGGGGAGRLPVLAGGEGTRCGLDVDGAGVKTGGGG